MPVGGNLALDLANTASARERPQVHEKLHTYADVVVWAERTGVLGPERAARLRAEAEARPAEAAVVLARTLELREAIYRVLSSVAVAASPAPADVAVLNQYVEEAGSHRRLRGGERGFEWGWGEGDEPLAQLLWPAAWAAAELLAEGELGRVKQCGNDGCNWLFVDLSRNRSRRWCDMKDCGNRAKARRHYARRRRGTG